LWLHKSRTLLVVLAIAVGIVGAGAVLNTWALVRRVTRESFLASHPASATLRLDSVTAGTLEQVAAWPEIRDVAARRTVFSTARAQGGGGWLTAVLFTMDDFTDVRIGRLKPEAGSWPPPDGAVIMEQSSLAFSGAAVGEPITIMTGDGAAVTLPVAGAVRDVGLAPGWMEHVIYGFVTRATLTSLGLPSTPNQLQILVDGALDRGEVRRIAYQVKADLERAGHRVEDVDVPEPGEHIHAAQMNSLLFTQGAFGGLALVLSGFLVVNLITAMLAGQVREIGVMKAIGAGPAQIAAMYLGLALVLGLVASSLALPGAMYLGYRYAELKAELLNFDLTGYTLPVGVVLLQVIAGALLPVAAAALPVWHGCRVTVGEALRDVGMRAEGRPTAGLVSRVSGVGRPLLLSLRNAFRRRQRMALTLAALATGGAVYIGALNLRTSVRGAVDLVYRPMRFDFSVRLTRAWPPESLETTAAAVPGVTLAEAWGGARAAVSHPDGTVGNAFAITALPPTTQLLSYATSSPGRWLQVGDSNTLVVSRGLLRDEPGLTVGAPVTLVVDGLPSQWTLVGVVDAGPSATAFAARAAVTRLSADRTVDRIVVAGGGAGAAGSASRLELIGRVRTALDRAGYQVQSTQLVTEGRRVLEDHLLMVVEFLAAMAWLMIVVGGLGLASTMGLAVLERTREIGVLRAIGARHRAIVGMVLVEGLVIAVLSWVVAVPLSVPMSLVLGEAFGRIMLPVASTVMPQAWAVLVWLGLVVLVSLTASAWPALRATRIPTAAALAYE
ncbi:MAG TPA: ABC transporter permease, partial [Gemmatimonadales bacterium]|nr:ABC transporter permease [Gemmatimonadales bacterium]